MQAHHVSIHRPAVYWFVSLRSLSHCIWHEIDCARISRGSLEAFSPPGNANMLNYTVCRLDEAALFCTLRGKDTAEARDFALLQHAQKVTSMKCVLGTTDRAEVGNTLIGVLEKRTSPLCRKAHSLSICFFTFHAFDSCRNVTI